MAVTIIVRSVNKSFVGLIVGRPHSQPVLEISCEVFMYSTNKLTPSVANEALSLYY